MVRTQLVKIFFKTLLTVSLAWLVPITASVLAQTVKITAISGIGAANGEVQARFQLPCGAKFLGVVARRRGGLIELGVAYQNELLRCAQIPEMKSVGLPWVNERQVASLRPLAAVGRKGTWRTAPALLLSSKTSAGSPSLDLVYTSSCSQYGLPLFSAKGDRIVGVGALEYFPGPRPSECRAVEKRIHLGVIGSSKLGLEYQVIGPDKANLRRSHSIYLAKILEKGIHRIPGQGITVSYNRRCNEVPVGLVLSPVRLVNGLRHAQVGVVVSRFHHRACDIGSGGDEVATLTIPLLEFSGEIRLSPFDLAVAGSAIRLRVPAISDLMVEGQQRGIALDYVEACSEVLGAVYHFRYGESLAVGVLERPSLVGTCPSGARQVSLPQPYLDGVAAKGALPIVPMRVLGS